MLIFLKRLIESSLIVPVSVLFSATPPLHCSRGFITPSQMVELGSIIENPSLGRTDDEQITIADLTGVAIQDLQIAVAAYTTLLASQ